ncbi:MAG: hypothetical protein Q7J78_03625 [Clostridiales bacterium]|nr:hypothetical protein [Clostridiales bacterium]
MNGKKEQRRKELYDVLGELPSLDGEISVKKFSEEEHEFYILEKLMLDLNGIQPVPAYFVRTRKTEGRGNHDSVYRRELK